MAPSSLDLSILNSTSRLLSILDLNEHPQSMQNMENMSIDLLTVPDTPDRLTTENISYGGGGDNVEEVNSSSVVGNSGISNLSDKGVYHRVRDHGRLNIENVNNTRLLSRPRGDIGNGDESQQSSHPVINVVDSPSVSKNARLYRRMLSGKVSSQSQPTEHVSSSNDRAKVDGDDLTIAELLASEDRIQGKNKEKMTDLSSSPEMPSNTLYLGGRNMRKKTLLQDNMRSDIDDGSYSSAAVGVDCGKGIHIHSDSKQTVEHIMSHSLQSTTAPRKNGQKRLVRNGCISPHNIAKAKRTHVKSCKDGRQDDIEKVVPNFRVPPNQIHIVSPISEGNYTDTLNTVKGKGVMEEPSAQKYDNETLPSRNSLNLVDEANEIEDASEDALKNFEEIGGWRSTHNHSDRTSLTLSDEVGHFSRKNRLGHFHEIKDDPVSFQHGLTPCSAQASSVFRSELDREGGQHCGASKLARRQRKHGSACSNSGECSTSINDDLEISYLWSSNEPSNARSTRSRSYRHRGNARPVIEIDELSPEVLRRGPQNTTQMVNDDSDARARQVEADEMLARELQEQFYHELPGVGGGEIDASIAWSLQREEEAQRAASLRRQRVHPRDASMSHLYRQHQTQAPQNSLIRSTSRVNRARGPTSARMATLQERFLGQSPTISSRERSFHFPRNMDVEMRIHILEALEAAVGNSDGITTAANFFQVQRDFNENDYEMLLALDENNHQHVGASPAQINGLPQSTVQSDNFAEACAICLETPTTGDTIRHLPCLHKFHKDCIDPWLRRKTSCPVCKSGIT